MWFPVWKFIKKTNYNVLKAKLLFEIPEVQKKKFPTNESLIYKESGKWKAFSTSEFIEQRDRVSYGLLALDIKKDDKIGIISFNRPQWNFVDLGTQQIGAITVPMYPNISQDQYKFILDQAEVKVLFVEDEELFKTVSEIKDDLHQLKEVYTFQKVTNAKFWEDLLTDNDSLRKKVDERRSGIEEDDLASIVYTSGTTGNPKGVMLSHKNIMSNVKSCLPLLPVAEGARALSFLPLNHIFERMLSFVYMASGLSIYYAEDIDSIANNMKEVRPHIFTTVPRLLEKIYEKIVRKGASAKLPVRAIFFGALSLAKNFSLKGNSVVYKLLLQLANVLVFSKWRDALGGEVKLIVSGGAALNPKLTRIFTAAQLPIMEGYGLTETSPVIAVNRWEVEKRKIGSVGLPLENVKVKIAEDGEILCKGPNIMKGYYKNREKTDEVIKDGWFHTEDLGEIDDEGFLSVTDRQDSVFKTSGGKKVAPQPIENLLKESSLVDQAIVLGEERKMVTALISPDFDNLKGWCEVNNVTFTNSENVVESSKVKERYGKIIDGINDAFSQIQQIKKFRLVVDQWSTQSGELTPTQKVKRPVIKEKYKKLIEEMYAEEQ
jgi:long-chain acyl-CoA synthetase